MTYHSPRCRQGSGGADKAVVGIQLKHSKFEASEFDKAHSEARPASFGNRFLWAGSTRTIRGSVLLLKVPSVLKKTFL